MGERGCRGHPTPTPTSPGLLSTRSSSCPHSRTLTSRFELVLGRGQPGLSLPGQGQGPSCSSCLSGEDPGTPETGQIGGVLEPHTGLGLDTCSGRTGRTQSRHHWLFHLTLGIQHAVTHHKVLTHTSHTSYIPQSPHSTYHTHMLTHNTKTLHKEPER